MYKHPSEERFWIFGKLKGFVEPGTAAWPRRTELVEGMQAMKTMHLK